MKVKIKMLSSVLIKGVHSPLGSIQLVDKTDADYLVNMSKAKYVKDEELASEKEETVKKKDIVTLVDNTATREDVIKKTYSKRKKSESTL